MAICNATSEIHWNVEPYWHSLSVHEIGWLISGVFAIIATVISLYLIFRHATNYTVPEEQRHVIRILLMIPIYALVSFASYVWYWYAIYWEVIRDCYEAFAIASFFALMCGYVAPTLRQQKQFFRKKDPGPWPWPATWMNKLWKNSFRKPRSGLTWFNIIWIGVFQYCFIRVSMTIVSLVTQLLGRYCEDSLSPAFAHVWVLGIEIVGITIAMYLLVAFYISLKTELAPYRPGLKLLSIKLVIFFSFWQGIVIDFLASKNVLKPNQYISKGDIDVGLNTLLICIEMAGFAILHIWAFSWKDYLPSRLNSRQSIHGAPVTTAFTNKGGFWGLRALGDALNPWDLVKGFGRGMRWLFVGRKKRHTESLYSKDDDYETTELEFPNKNGNYQAENQPVSNRPQEHSGLLPEGQQPMVHMPPMPISDDGYEPMRQRQYAAGGPGSVPGYSNEPVLKHTSGPTQQPYPEAGEFNQHFPKEFA